MQMSREELIEWHVTRRELYMQKGFSYDDAAVLAVIDAIEETAGYKEVEVVDAQTPNELP